MCLAKIENRLKRTPQPVSGQTPNQLAYDNLMTLGDKLPFDDEMVKNQKAIKVLQRLFDAGYGTEKEIVNMAMDEMLALPGVNVADLCIISELQKSIKANKVISYLSGKKEVKEETKGADYGGTT